MKTALLEQHTATDKKIEKIELDTIITKGLQTRAGTDPAKVAEYAEIYKAGGPMPPIVVFSDGGDEFYLGDGHHRLAAAKKAELEEIEGLIKKGDRRDALWYATAANAQHGLPRTNEDKRKAVGLILADAEWRTLSDAQLAEHAQVSDRLIAKVRKELGAESNTRKGKDGKTRTKPAAKPKPKAEKQETISAIAEADRAREFEEFSSRCTTLMRYWRKTGLADLGVVRDPYLCRVIVAMADWPATSDYPVSRAWLAKATYLNLRAVTEKLSALSGVVVETPTSGEYYIAESLVKSIKDIFAPFDANRPRTSGIAEIPDTDGPEEITEQSSAAVQESTPASRPEQSSSKSLPSQALAPVQESPLPAKPEKPAPPQTLGDKILIAERDLIAVELLKGKPQWTGTDNDLLALALIVGVPTRKQAWIDSVRANARHLFVDALRSEVADRVRNGEHTNRGWPVTPELCRLWGLDYQALHLRAQHQVPS